jgi:hypothetical protein
MELPGKAIRPKVDPPFPLNDTVCGLLGALSVMVIVPVRLPFAVGLKVTVREQV